MDNKEILIRLKNDPSFINELNDDNDEFKLFIIRNNGSNIKYIKNPSIELQKEAVKRYPLAVKYIENLDEEAAILSVKSSWNTLEYIKDASEKVIKAAVSSKGWAIQYVNNPNEEIQILAVEKDYDSIKYIENPSERVQLKAINNYYAAIRFIKEPTLKAKLLAVKQNGEAVNYISNYDLDEVKYFISENINVVKYIYDSIDVDLVVEVLIEKVKDDDIEEDYIKNFLELEVLEMDKINFIREYGSKNAKKILVDYKLSM